MQARAAPGKPAVDHQMRRRLQVGTAPVVDLAAADKTGRQLGCLMILPHPEIEQFVRSNSHAPGDPSATTSRGNMTALPSWRRRCGMAVLKPVSGASLGRKRRKGGGLLD